MKIRVVWLVCLGVVLGMYYTGSTARVLIFTYSYNRPDFIEIQHKTFKKFLADDYEFVVFNDAPGQEMCNAINAMCARYSIRCIRIPQEIHSRPYLYRCPGENFNDPAVRNCNVVQYSLDVVGFDHNDILLLLDSDMFLIRPFSIRTFMQEYDVAGLKQIKLGVDYIWIGLVFLNMKTMPNKRTINFNCGCIKGKSVDAGGYTHYYLEQNPSARVCFIDHTNLLCTTCNRSIFVCDHNKTTVKNINASEHLINLTRLKMNNIEVLFNGTFFHYRGGTNWDNKSDGYHAEKTRILNNFIDAIVRSN